MVIHIHIPPPSDLAADRRTGLDDEDDIVMVDGDDLTSPEKSTRDRKGKPKVIADPSFKAPPAVPMPPGDYDLPERRKRMPPTKDMNANSRLSKQTKQDDDIVMVDAGGPSENPGLKRSDSSAKKPGLSGMFGGLLAKSRPDNKRRSTALTDDEGARGLRREDRKIKRAATDRSQPDIDVTMSGGAAEEDQEAKREARRARRAEREAAEKTADEARRIKDEERRERRRKQEEEAEAKLREEKESRRAARREQKAREEEDRLAAEVKDAARTERRRARRAERDVQTDGEPMTEDPVRLKKSDRRKSHMDGPVEDDEDRRRRREERHRMRSSDAPRTSRRKSAPVVNDYFDSRNGSKKAPEYLPADGPVYKNAKSKKVGWPHSGTDSWVQDHSDAPPPPDDTPAVEPTPAEDPIADENARRELRKTRRHSKYDDGADDQDERRRRKESRRAEKENVKSSEGSQGDGRRSSRRESAYIDSGSRAPSAQGGLFGRLKKIAGV